MKKTLFSILIFILLLCGCGKTGADKEKTSMHATDTWEPLKVLNHTWKGYTDVKEDAEPWHSDSYSGGFCVLPAGEKTVSEPAWSWCGDTLYTLSYCYEQAGENNTFFFRLWETDTVSMTEKCLKFELFDMIMSSDTESVHSNIDTDEWGELCEAVKRGSAQLTSLDVFGDRICFCFVRLEASEEGYPVIAGFYCLETDRGLNVRGLVDLTEPLFGGDTVGLYVHPQGYFTKDGEICIIDTESRQMSVFAWDGTRKAGLDLKDILGNMYTTLAGRADDGTPVFQSSDGSYKVTYFTPEGAIYKGDGYLPLSCLDDVGEMLLWKDSDLVRWNIETGEAVKLCSLSGLTWTDCRGFRKNSAGNIVLAYVDGNELCFYVYSVGAASESVLRIALFYDNCNLEGCAADYERTHPGVKIEFVSFDNPYRNSMALNLLAIDCKKENAPDMILFTSKEQMDILRGAGCLAPVDNMISEDTKNGLFDCILDLGKAGDGYYGITYQVNVECFLVSKSDWNRDSWTVRELMDCYRGAKEKESGPERFMALSYAADSRQLLSILCVDNMDDTPFVDFENGTSDFDCDEFKELLEFCKEYADPASAEIVLKTDECAAQARSGKAFSLLAVGGIQSYSYNRASLGSGFAPVGIPSESGMGYIAETNSILSVNAFSGNKDLAADFLEYLLSERCQVRFGNGRWVRKDVIQSHIIEHAVGYDQYGNEEAQCWFDLGNGVTELAVDENGDSFVPEFIAIMDKARPYSAHGDVRDIILEEADAYFKGAKSVDEVARVIQSRVYIYLQENK